eukprot:s3682_g7.t1
MAELSAAENSLVVAQAIEVLILESQHVDHKQWWAPPLTCDAQCSSRWLGIGLGADFSDKPLKDLEAKFVQKDKCRPGASPGVSSTRRALEQLKSSSEPVARLFPGQAALERLLNELDGVAKEAQVTCHLGSSSKLASRVALLAKELETQREEELALHARTAAGSHARHVACKDAEKVQLAISAAENLVNEGSARDWLLRAGGSLPRLGFSSLAAALIAREPDATLALRAVSSSVAGERELSRCES